MNPGFRFVHVVLLFHSLLVAHETVVASQISSTFERPLVLSKIKLAEENVVLRINGGCVHHICEDHGADSQLVDDIADLYARLLASRLITSHPRVGKG